MRQETFGQFSQRMEDHRTGKARYFRLRVRLQYSLASNTGCRKHQSLSSIACDLRTFGQILEEFSKCSDMEEYQRRVEFYNITPSAVLREIATTTGRIREKREQLCAAGINPQAHIVVKPKMDRTRESVLVWKACLERLMEP